MASINNTLNFALYKSGRDFRRRENALATAGDFAAAYREAERLAASGTTILLHDRDAGSIMFFRVSRPDADTNYMRGVGPLKV